MLFVSVKELRDNLGVNDRIARFFVDRKVPQGNKLWEGKLLYVGRGNGFLFIPVYYDGLFRVGVSIDDLLNETHIQFMEKIMDFSTQVEYHTMTFAEQLEKISALLHDRIQGNGFYDELMNYLNQGTLHPIGRLGTTPPALNRADVFLFILCHLRLTDQQLEAALNYWYALAPTFLAMDDITDYQKDKEDGDENAVIESGDGGTGFERTFEKIEQNIAALRKTNPSLANAFQAQLAGLHDYIV